MYSIALGVADALDRANLDLWASGVRACLDAPSTLQRQQHLTVELVRLRDTAEVDRAGCLPDIAMALDRLEVGLGTVDVAIQPLYSAMRVLADHLELNGGRRWLQRLRVVAHDPDRTAEARMARLAALLDRMAPGAEGLPEGSAQLVRAVAERLDRHADAATVARYLAFALRPPAPSRATEAPVPIT